MKSLFGMNLAVILLTFIAIPRLSVAEGRTSVPEDKGATMKDTIHVLGHAHMDMNWLWTWSETMKMANDNLRQTVAFMD